MARNDIRIVETGGSNVSATYVWQTEAAATAILAGEPVKLKSAGSPYAIPLADGDPINTTTAVIGIAAKDSTQTAAADGEVEVYIPKAGMVYEAKAKTASTADTQAEIDALVGDRVYLDLTGSTYSVDAAAGDNANNGVVLVGGDPERTTLKFLLRGSFSILN